MTDKEKKHDLRDDIAARPTSTTREDRKFAEEPLDSEKNEPRTVKPGPEVQSPRQTAKQ